MQEDFNFFIEKMKEALTVSAMLIARQIADRIQDDYGLVFNEDLVGVEEEEEEE